MSFGRVGSSWWCAAGLCAALWAPDARAWYFPEHAELARLAFRDFAPSFVETTIEGAVRGAPPDLLLCRAVPVALDAIPTSGDGTTCVSYGVLAALAGDHASTADDLYAALSRPIWRPWPASDRVLGVLLTAAAQGVWVQFESSAPVDVVRMWTMEVSRLSPGAAGTTSSLSPRDFVRTLDAKLFAIDGQYVSRAKDAKTHFHNATSSVQTVVADAVQGDLDNALAQVLAHHARSLQLAVRSRHEPDATMRRTLRTEALLEHAFAVHFLQDGFAAGHIMTDPAIALDQNRTQRHDYFNRQGLAATRALALSRCGREPPDWSGSQLLPCWVAHGDGFAMGEDRVYVNEAVARLQTSFALALDDGAFQHLKQELDEERCKSWIDGGAPKETCDVAWTVGLLDPLPALFGRELPVCAPAGDGKAPTGASRVRCWAERTLGRHGKALQKLGSTPLLAAADADTPNAQPGVLSPEVVGDPFGGFTTSLREDSSTVESPTDDDIGILWVPLLAAWPGPQADPTTLEGTDSFGRGFKAQIVASLATSYARPFTDSGSLAVWAGAGAGITYTAQGVFPKRHTRALAELNGGFAEGVTLAGPADRYRSIAIVELRAPLTTLMIYGVSALFHSGRPLDLVGENVTFGFLGARAYFSLNPDQAVFTGWDVEVMNVLLDRNELPHQASKNGILDTEGRLRLGVRSDDPHDSLSFPFGGGFMAAFEVNSGLFF
jgi:hypothetical protein